MNALDKYETYAVEQNTPQTTNLNIISCCYGLFESIPIKLLLSADGSLYTLEQLYKVCIIYYINNRKNSEFIMRLSKILELKGVEYIMQLTEKKLIFAVEKQTGVV